MEAKGVTFSMVKGLVGFLKTNMPSVQQAVDDFPNPNQKLIFPAISVMTKSPVYVPFQPYVIAKGEKDLATGKYPVTKVMGSWDFSFQIDLWAESKPARVLECNEQKSGGSRHFASTC